MQNKNSNTIVWIVVILVLIIGAYFLFRNKADVAPVTNDTVSESTEDTTEGSENVASTSALSYTDAVAKYGDKRIQLNSACQAMPNNVTYKAGTSIMIDNRSPQTAKVRLGGVFSIKPYGFKIVKLSSANLPATYYIDCGTSQNVATVLVQK